MKKTLAIICGIAAAALLVPTAAQADLVVGDVFLIDFSDADSTMPTKGGTWNRITSAMGTGSSKDLVDTVGDGSALLTLVCADNIAESSRMDGGWENTGSPPNDFGAEWVDIHASNDCHYIVYGGSVGNTGAVAVTGLDNSLKYTVELVSSRHPDVLSYGPVVADYWLDGSLTSQEVSSDNFNSVTSGYTARNVMIWDSVETGGDGRLTLSMEVYSNAEKYGVFSALRIEVVPEPATMGLLGLGFAGMAAFRRRRRNK